MEPIVAHEDIYIQEAVTTTRVITDEPSSVDQETLDALCDDANRNEVEQDAL